MNALKNTQPVTDSTFVALIDQEDQFQTLELNELSYVGGGGGADTIA